MSDSSVDEWCSKFKEEKLTFMMKRGRDESLLTLKALFSELIR